MCFCCVFFLRPYLDGTTGNTASFSSHGNASNGTATPQHDTYAPWYSSAWDYATDGPGKKVRLILVILIVKQLKFTKELNELIKMPMEIKITKIFTSLCGDTLQIISLLFFCVNRYI